ncbi:MAG: septum formation inhibitor Maf [Pseudomonadales bacterium]|uniref:Maf family protein n=1 Tax=unclassified Ketobacter TaxID=2639109 RepID=UPI000C97912F|nr:MULTISPECIES: Maf family protein [unclassified Ketobacter]MAQ26239.1 septum formation inhibitor Maf [Pseudomonadales bacterium]MEC8809928.1 Maf family protein [Pseudomonadota bacterium]TNC90356.1 MAG: septum formation inhibitor Maf [Alcanivorax sp.]HAG92780.1 septum formation inhibitor Maf [Gammaproteobacteria bacterium]MCK5791780.1 septum formation inhibitor Maf [Ketobacter sp.]
MKQIVLGSSSPFRKELLRKLIPEFETCSPDIDETPHAGETPKDLVGRLAIAKAKAVAAHFPSALIIASDQVSVLNDKINGKPGNQQQAFLQLKASSGNTVTFFTSLCLYDASTHRSELVVEPFHVHFRHLKDDEINRYLDKEAPFNCAGSFKSEGLGISLFRKLEGDDPNALIGLPLIKLADLLRNQGIQIP